MRFMVSLPRSQSIHDEAHDGSEVVSMKGHLRWLGHVQMTSVPGTFTASQTFQPLPTIGWLKHVYTGTKTVQTKTEIINKQL